MPFRYRIIVEYSDLDDCYVALAPAFPGCAGGGDTPAEAVTELVESAQVVLEVAAERGELPIEDIGQDYSGNIRLRLPRQLHRQLAQVAAADETSLNQIMVALLSQRMSRKQGVG